PWGPTGATAPTRYALGAEPTRGRHRGAVTRVVGGSVQGEGGAGPSRPAAGKRGRRAGARPQAGAGAGAPGGGGGGGMAPLLRWGKDWADAARACSAARGLPPAGVSAHPFGNLATGRPAHSAAGGPMALRPRLTTGLPLSRMKRVIRSSCRHPGAVGP